MKRVAIYVRVSTMEQAQEGFSIPAQKERLTMYCKAKDWLVTEIYVDGGYSGGNTDRPALNKMLQSLNDIDIVLVYKLDRLSRSQKDTLYLIEDKFIANDVDFVSITENFDTTTPFGRAMIGILSVFAQLERENIKERSKMGRIERAKKGLWAGTPHAPIGYDLIDSTLVVNEYEAMQVREVFDLYLKGYGNEKIQKVFLKKGYTTKYGTWENISSHTIYRIVQNRVYLGDVSYAKQWYPGIHDPIITQDLFDKANHLHKSRKGSAPALKYFLSGLLYCKQCGEKFLVDKKGDRVVYVCKNRKKAYKQDFRCDNKIFTIPIAEDMAISKMKDMVKNKDDVIRNKYNSIENKEIKKENTVINKRIEEIDKQINKLMDLYQLDNIPIDQFSKRIEKLYEEKKSITLVIEDEISEEGIDIEEILDVLKDFDTVWDELEVEQKKEIAAALLGNKIFVTKEGL